MSAELIDVNDRGRLGAGLLADIIAGHTAESYRGDTEAAFTDIAGRVRVRVVLVGRAVWRISPNTTASVPSTRSCATPPARIAWGA